MITLFLWYNGKNILKGGVMKEYVSKAELTNAIKASYKKYIDEFKNIPEDLKDKRFEEVDRTPAENLAYQVGWTTLLLK